MKLINVTILRILLNITRKMVTSATNENVNVMPVGCLRDGCLMVGCLQVGCLYGCLHVEVLVLCVGYANNVCR